MSVISPTIDTKNAPGDGSVVSFSWALVTNGDTGAPMAFTQWTDRSVQLNGTFGGTIVWEGSNDGTNYETLTDAQGVAMSYTANALKQAVEVTLYARPRVAAGVTGVTVTCVARRQSPNRI